MTNEIWIRLATFSSIFVLMAFWEIRAPRRQLRTSKSIRWLNNLGLVITNSIILRLIFPTAAVGVASLTQAQDWGLIGYYSVPSWAALLISIVAMDFFIWLQHVMMHAIPILWRLHRVHHADLDFDVTTGARFHPIEILLSMLIKFAIIVLLGPPVVAVVLFEVILNATSLFSHGNIYIPHSIDRWLRLFVVTPDMHRVHHSIEDDETNSNFGFNLSCWDRLFGTYQAQPRAGHEAMVIGIHRFRDDKWCSWLPGMLTLPFAGKVGDYAINRRHWSNEHLP